MRSHQYVVLITALLRCCHGAHAQLSIDITLGVTDPVPWRSCPLRVP